MLPDPKSFGQVISLDTTHLVAWVKENNPRVFIKQGRYDKNKQPAGDPDCKLGVKKRSNQKPATPLTNPQPASHRAVCEVYWGYGSGIVVTKVAQTEVVLAEFTQPFNESEVSYFFPLLADTERRLGFRPKYAALDAAFDAWYIYQYFHEAGGLAAVPLSKRGKANRRFDEQGLPLCDAGLAMPVKHRFVNRRAFVPHLQARHACPLLFPTATNQTCPIQHKNWPKGGCTTTLATAQGARIRHQLDREDPLYKDIYRQRTATERIFSLAKSLGIERPKLRNQCDITNQNTLTYLLLNLYALARLSDQDQSQD